MNSLCYEGPDVLLADSMRYIHRGADARVAERQLRDTSQRTCRTGSASCNSE